MYIDRVNISYATLHRRAAPGSFDFMKTSLYRWLGGAALAVVLGGCGPLFAQRQAVEARHGMVTSVHGIASEAGVDILRRGGNAVDAALATGFLVLVTGSPGGPTIIDTVFQIITNVIDFEMPVMQAVEAPRVHHQWLPDEMNYERYGLSVDTIRRLVEMGHKLVPTAGTGYQGDAESIAVDPGTGKLLGAADPRQPDSRAVGL